MINVEDIGPASITGEKIALKTITRDHIFGLEAYIREVVQQELARNASGEANNPYLPPTEQETE